MTPEESLERLMAGNQRYVQDKLEHPDRTTERREAVSSKQEPFVAILGCSDSRVPPEIVFDQGVGDAFVVRVAGNVVGPVELDSLEYAVKHLHSSLIMVLGHAKCGAVKAVVDGQTSDIEAVAELIAPSVKKCKEECKCDSSSEDLLNLCIRTNVNNVVDYIKKSSLIEQYIKEKKVGVVGGYYNLDTGKVELIP